MDQDALRPLEETERETLEAVEALERVTESIEHHVEVIEGLATSVGPLTESVNQLTATMQQLVELLGPMAAAEREVHKAEHFFGLRRHKHDEPGQATSD